MRSASSKLSPPAAGSSSEHSHGACIQQRPAKVGVASTDLRGAGDTRQGQGVQDDAAPLHSRDAYVHACRHTRFAPAIASACAPKQGSCQPAQAAQAARDCPEDPAGLLEKASLLANHASFSRTPSGRLAYASQLSQLGPATCHELETWWAIPSRSSRCSDTLQGVSDRLGIHC